MWEAIGAVAAPIVGSIIGSHIAAGDRENAGKYQQQALDVLMQAGAPPDVAKALVLKEYQARGIPLMELEPEVENVVSQMAQVKEDPSTRQAQMQALQSLQQVGASGMRPEDRAMMLELQDQAAQEAKSQQQAVLQNMQQRGMAGSGAEVAALLGSQQGAANQGMRNAMKVSSDASQRALQALAQSGSLGGNIRSQDFNVEQSKAEAQDQMNRFNTQNQIARQQRNIATTNEARMKDWANRQSIDQKNVDLYNAEQERQNAAKQWMYQADLKRRGAQSDALKGVSQYHQNRADRTQDLYSNIGSGVAKGIGAFGSMNKAVEPEVASFTDQDEDSNLSIANRRRNLVR